MRLFLSLLVVLSIAVGCKADRGPSAQDKLRTFSEQAKRFTPGGTITSLTADKCVGLLPSDNKSVEYEFTLEKGAQPDFTPGAAGGETPSGTDQVIRRPEKGVVAVGKLINNKKNTLSILVRYKADEASALARAQMMLTSFETLYDSLPGPALGE